MDTFFEQIVSIKKSGKALIIGISVWIFALFIIKLAISLWLFEKVDIDFSIRSITSIV